ncbi:response regulator [Sphaerospermopsis aphanizomenoides BCCUSP55]|uniref:hybrid sensor histidine kinase/response regulator n=1 Tax=Sphaerospermopsis aphanizomenoides TaxID=459663 RepID=UPI001907772D|nr:response regulator [Sphaerospermopsis aphanizomenoides]MBK1988062.1 response regulator [Sphaerospermopsis aphanizomenoides BCCUSP55]
MQPEQQQRILGYFIEEAREHLNTIEQGLLKLQDTLNDPEMINEVFRAAHSIKGGAAMLGLGSIQQTSHRLEDCFKVLKEHTVQVDQKLESLFLGVSDTLKALLDHLGSPFGLSEETANTLMLETEPLFQGLNEHLEQLVKSQDSNTPVATQTVIKPPIQDAAPQQQPQKTVVANEQWSEFHTQVLQSLREMLQLFKQSNTSSSREKLQACCQRLVKLGEKLNLTNWCRLSQTAGNAIANPDNTYLTLAKIVITEIKQAQELVTQGREAEINVSPELEALELIPELEFPEIQLDWVDDQPQAETQIANTLEIHTDNVLLPANSTIKFTPIQELNLAADTDQLPNLARTDTNATAERADSLFTNQNDIFNLNSDIFDLNGLEVGIAELNTLADLFEGDTPELEIEAGWQQPEIVETTTNIIGISDSEFEDVDHDFSDILSLDNDTSNHQPQRHTNITEDLALLFGDTFLETENPEHNDVSLTNPNLELSVTNINSEDLAVDTLEIAQSIEENDLTNINAVELIGSLWELTPDANESISLETVTSSASLGTANSLDDLLANTNADVLEELAFGEPELETSIPQSESLSLDNLFGELTTHTSANTIATTDDLEINEINIFALPETISTASSQIEDDFNNFWNSTDITSTLPLTPGVREDVVKELEDDIFAAASGETVNDSQQSQVSLSFYLEDFDFTIPKPVETGYITSNTDAIDNLFADWTDSQTTSSTVDDDKLSLPTIDSFSQEPEVLDFIPEFTHQSSQIDADLEDLFAGFDDNHNENRLAFLENVVTSLSIDEHDQITEVDPDQAVDLSLSELTQLELLDQESDTGLVQEGEIALDSQLLELELGLEAEITADIADQTPVTLEEAHPQQLEPEITAASTQTNQAAMAEDEFAALDALLDQEADLSTNQVSIPDLDFAALEALLNTDEVQATEIPTPAPIVDPPMTIKVPSAIASSAPTDEFKELEDLLAQADQTMNAAGRTAKSNTSKTPRPSIRRFKEESMKIPVKQLDEMSNLVGELVVNRNTLEQDHERLRQSLDNLLIQVQHLSDVGARMQELYERSLLEASLLSSRRTREYGHSNHAHDRGFSELEMDQFTLFHTLSQETIEYIVRVRESASDIDFVTEETERVARQFRQVTTQLQEGLTRARMVPFAQAIDRLRRGVRDNGIKYGKQVDLVTEGADTPIDKMILDHLTDPLTHMLNNAIAHGIETPEVRKAKGKPPIGTITIRAFHQGNQTVISVTDDGAGIDHEKVKLKAIQKGVITPEEAQKMTRQDFYELLFLPSFSTADEIDDIKGRGVGMNVVENDINEIRGTVSTDSVLGKGTTFTIRLPLTLQICKALCCISDKSRIAFPIDGVEDTLDIPVTDIHKDFDGQSFIYWRDTSLPFRPLQEILAFNRQISRGSVYSSTREDDMVSVVVLRSGNTMVALQIDQVLSEQEIVIKQFEGPAPKPSGVAGATVLGDGRIMPIADVLEIIDIFQGKMSKHIGGGSWQRKAVPLMHETPDVKIEPTVLIVDDSITVRELLSLTFNKAGYRVEQARDGQEAWDKLRSGLPCDIVFCDIEMPRCDGLELLSRIQKDGTLNHLPIAMLTSRGADKHKQMAVQLGASGYFTKPYLEEALLEAATRMLRGEKLVMA